MNRPFWLSVFLDFSADDLGPGVAFWRDVTGYRSSPARGEHDEFGTLVPPDGDDYLRWQRLEAGSSRLHLDLHVADLRSATRAALAAGADQVRDEQDYVVLTSPGRIICCFVTHPGRTVPSPASWTADEVSFTSRLDQVCLDLPAEVYDTETAFWSGLFGVPLTPSPTHREFARITPLGTAIKLLVQRLEEPTGPARLHLDLATTDRTAEVARHRGLGAELVREHDQWSVLRSPTGQHYCVTARRP